jgi:hypothetical protein
VLGRPLLGFLKSLVSLSQMAPQSQRVALDNVMGNMRGVSV